MAFFGDKTQKDLRAEFNNKKRKELLKDPTEASAKKPKTQEEILEEILVALKSIGWTLVAIFFFLVLSSLFS